MSDEKPSADPKRPSIDDAMLRLLDQIDPGAIAAVPHLGDVVVKFVEGSGVRTLDRTFVIDQGALDPALLERSAITADRVTADVTELGVVLGAIADAGAKAGPVPLFGRPAEELHAEKRALDADAGAPGKGSAIADRSLYAVVPAVAGGAAATRQVLAELNGRATVELAYLAPLPAAPSTDLAPPTPMIGRQGYFDPAPSGIDAAYAWNVPGAKGVDVRIVDVECAWRTDHEDFPRVWRGDVFRVNPFNWLREEHGAAVAGILCAPENGYGVSGLVPMAQLGLAGVGLGGVAAALDEAGSWLQPGDVIVIEVQLGGPSADLLRYMFGDGDQRGMVPVEFFPAEFDAIRRLTERGIIVVEPAGNGQMDLDSPGVFRGVFDRSVRDSGAILVGAGTPDGAQPEGFTNFGTRVDLNGWGSGVTTLMGPSEIKVVADDPRQWYTADFGGTSAATPIVASAAAAVQGALRSAQRPPLTPSAMRDLLVETGTPQGTGSPPGSDRRVIGRRPDLRRALDRLGLRPPARSDWPSLGGIATSDPIAGRNADGRLEVFILGADRRLWRQHETPATGGWSGWFALADGLPREIELVGRPCVIVNGAGRLEVFARASDAAVWHVWQDPGAPTGWAGWSSLGGRATSDPAVEINDNGRLEVFVRWEDRSIHHAWQRFPGSAWSGWHSRGGTFTSGPAVGHNADRRLEVFARGDDGRLYQQAQTTPGGGWTHWIGPAGAIETTPAVGQSVDGPSGFMEVFALAPGGAIDVTWQTAPNNGWHPAMRFADGAAAGSRPTVVADGHGLLHLFLRKSDGSVRTIHKTGSPPAWSAWQDLGGNVSGDLGAGVGADGRVVVFGRARTGDVVLRVL